MIVTGEIVAAAMCVWFGTVWRIVPHRRFMQEPRMTPGC